MAFWSDPSALFPKQSHRWVVSFQDNDSYAGYKDDRIPHYFAKSVDKPSYEIGSVQAKYLYSHTVNFPKRLIWKPIKIEFYDLYMPGEESDIIELDEQNITSRRDETKSANYSTQLFFYNLLSRAGYSAPNPTVAKVNAQYMSKYPFKEYLLSSLVGHELGYSKNIENNQSRPIVRNNFFMFISDLDDSGKSIETWKITNPLVTSVNFNKLDYSSDNILSITVDIVYDFAELIPVVKTEKKPPAASREEKPADKSEKADASKSKNPKSKLSIGYDRVAELPPEELRRRAATLDFTGLESPSDDTEGDNGPAAVPAVDNTAEAGASGEDSADEQEAIDKWNNKNFIEFQLLKAKLDRDTADMEEVAGPLKAQKTPTTSTTPAPAEPTAPPAVGTSLESITVSTSEPKVRTVEEIESEIISIDAFLEEAKKTDTDTLNISQALRLGAEVKEKTEKKEALEEELSNRKSKQ